MTHIFVVQLDIPADHEAEFNRVYDTEHFPMLSKVPGVRAALCHDTFSARQGVEDDDMNVLCLGARVIGPSLAEELVRAFLAARFSGAERHVRRLGKIRAIEQDALRGAFSERGPS